MFTQNEDDREEIVKLFTDIAIRLGKEMGPGCQSCRYSCHDRLLHLNRCQIFIRFWMMGSEIERRKFISGSIEETAVRQPQNSRRSRSLLYCFKVKGNRVRVCKTMFLHTLAVSKNEVVNALNAIKL